VSPRLVDKERRRREIAVKALDLFADRGFESTSVSQIAEAAGVAKGSVYLYFESKEELIFRALTAWGDLMMERTAPMLQGEQDPVARLRRVIHGMMDAFISDERSARIAVGLFQMYLNKPKFFTRYDVPGEVLHGARRIVTDILLEGVSRGIFPPETARDAEKIAVNLVAYLDGIGLHYHMSKPYFDIREQVDFYLSNLLATLTSAYSIEGSRSGGSGSEEVK
jgi:AcrR family transcriptional regulator